MAAFALGRVPLQFIQHALVFLVLFCLHQYAPSLAPLIKPDILWATLTPEVAVIINCRIDPERAATYYLNWPFRLYNISLLEAYKPDRSRLLNVSAHSEDGILSVTWKYYQSSSSRLCWNGSMRMSFDHATSRIVEISPS
jgi:hypothetical protein